MVPSIMLKEGLVNRIHNPMVLLNHEMPEIQDAKSSSSRRCLLLCCDHSETDRGTVTDVKRRVGI